MFMPRTADIARQTKETKIKIAINLDGSGKTSTATGVGFFDHMLDLLGRHSLIDLDVAAQGDLQVDAHHTVEDVGIQLLGQAIEKSLGDKAAGLRDMDRQLSRWMKPLALEVAIDLSGRPAFVYNAKYSGGMIGQFPVELVEEFFKALSTNARINLHINVAYGTNNHHIAEAIFKATARALRAAVSLDPRVTDVPSTPRVRSSGDLDRKM